MKLGVILNNLNLKESCRELDPSLDFVLVPGKYQKVNESKKKEDFQHEGPSQNSTSVKELIGSVGGWRA